MLSRDEQQPLDPEDPWCPGSPIGLGAPRWPSNDNLSAIPSWHPKLTVARLFVIFATISLGIAKAATSYRGDASIPVTLEWVMTIVVFVMFLIFNNLESRQDARPKWFFQFDTLDLVWRLLRMYQTEEIDTHLLLKPRYPPITGYRILVTSCVVSLGSLKAGLSYQGKSTEATTTEWVLGVVLTVSLYYLGLYEASATRVLPILFEEDFSKQSTSGIQLTMQAIDRKLSTLAVSLGSALSGDLPFLPMDILLGMGNAFLWTREDPTLTLL
ncbi:hypothetical protein BKA70DRAFT_1283149, partial [Coprinopsis sp. MPI-PUGE-AT-0042]